jgi:hypothetical protein
LSRPAFAANCAAAGVSWIEADRYTASSFFSKGDGVDIECWLKLGPAANRARRVMSKTEVFQFTVRDHHADSPKVGAHMATRRFIEMAKGTVVEGSRREIDSSLVDKDGKADISVQPGHTSRPKSE